MSSSVLVFKKNVCFAIIFFAKEIFIDVKILIIVQE